MKDIRLEVVVSLVINIILGALIFAWAYINTPPVIATAVAILVITFAIALVGNLTKSTSKA